ncbi:DUF1365 domain-containing protein [Psychromonas sp. MB-3u-54]|uniref:DUF1365 domain-containing protein n=1 Tax=Psychromonas sp. MB-3u-54 TaxID=2058319 RepID=UPI000C348DAF|nr:DUF1365 domain-containing protein [Psychromonas sp. MB-3u-54]PKH02921.1 DUF1365 domain-containing protein [Psychromonas sp. MB-3u-54]
MEKLNSCIYVGEVGHKRFTPREHHFSYKIFFLAIDLDEIEKLSELGRWFKWDKFAPLSFRSRDYLDHKKTINKQLVWQKVEQLGGENLAGRVMFIGQMRCFGLYFSPINLYYCYQKNNQLSYLLAEVSNTPWNERHYYLIDINKDLICDKAFPVSPFMDLEMQYHWHIKAPAEQLSLHIENHSDKKIFTASLRMKSIEFCNKNLRQCLFNIPVMTLKTLAGIYWQALKLFIKGVPFIGHAVKKEIDDGR